MQEVPCILFRSLSVKMWTRKHTRTRYSGRFGLWCEMTNGDGKHKKNHALDVKPMFVHSCFLCVFIINPFYKKPAQTKRKKKKEKLLVGASTLCIRNLLDGLAIHNWIYFIIRIFIMFNKHAIKWQRESNAGHFFRFMTLICVFEGSIGPLVSPRTHILQPSVSHWYSNLRPMKQS